MDGKEVFFFSWRKSKVELKSPRATNAISNGLGRLLEAEGLRKVNGSNQRQICEAKISRVPQ